MIFLPWYWSYLPVKLQLSGWWPASWSITRWVQFTAAPPLSFLVNKAAFRYDRSGVKAAKSQSSWEGVCACACVCVFFFACWALIKEEVSLSSRAEITTECYLCGSVRNGVTFSHQCVCVCVRGFTVKVRHEKVPHGSSPALAKCPLSVNGSTLTRHDLLDGFDPLLLLLWRGGWYPVHNVVALDDPPVRLCLAGLDYLTFVVGVVELEAVLGRHQEEK